MIDASLHTQFIEAIKSVTPSEGITLSPVKHVTHLRATKPRNRAPVLYDPQFVFAAQGSKQLYAGGKTYRYDAKHMLVLSIPLPIEGEIVDVSIKNPYLAVKIAIQPLIVTDLLAQIGPFTGKKQPNHGIHITPIDELLIDAVIRLLEASRHTETAKILGPQIVREIHYRVLRGPQGLALRSLVQGRGHRTQIARVLAQIHESVQRNWDIATLASEAHMSASSFHRHFKAVTDMSPLHYVKSLRLHCARAFMLHEGANAGEAAYRVGYKSASQFSREFKRLFGLAPSQDVSVNRDQGVYLPWPPATLNASDPFPL